MANNHPQHYFIENPKDPARYGLIRTCLRGKTFEFTTASSVFSIKQVDLGTRVLVESMLLPEKGNVLDIGCGYGVVGIVAAKLNLNLHVILTDVNRRAVLLARQNAEKNQVQNIKVKQGSYYEPVKGFYFNCILSNPPISAGMEIVKSIIRGASEVMSEHALFQMVVRSKIGKTTLPQTFKETFGNFKVLAIKSGYRVLVAEKMKNNA